MSKSLITAQALCSEVLKQYEFDQTLNARSPTQRFLGGIQPPGAFYNRLRNPTSTSTSVVYASGARSTVHTSSNAPQVEKTCHSCKQRKPEDQCLTCTSPVTPRRASTKYDDWSLSNCNRIFCTTCIQKSNCDALPNEMFSGTPCFHVVTKAHWVCPYCLDCCSCGDCATKREIRQHYITCDTPYFTPDLKLTYGLYTIKLIRFLKALIQYGPDFFVSLNKDKSGHNIGQPDGNPFGVNRKYSQTGYAQADYTDFSTPGLAKMLNTPAPTVSPDGTPIPTRRLAPFYYGDVFGKSVADIPPQSVYYQAMHQALAYQQQLQSPSPYQPSAPTPPQSTPQHQSPPQQSFQQLEQPQQLPQPPQQQEERQQGQERQEQQQEPLQQEPPQPTMNDE